MRGGIFIQSLRLFIWMFILLGIIYPLVIAGIAQISKDTAEGSIVIVNGKKVGSALISQKFEGEKYFWPRPSAVNYNPLASGGSNLSPTSNELKKQVEQRREKIEKSDKDAKAETIPRELLFASGSGLDPHINLKTAHFQVNRIAKARGLDEKGSEKLHNLIDENTEGSYLLFLGRPYVNVLKLNLALDKMQVKK